MTISSHLPDLIAAYIAARGQRLAFDKQAASAKEQEEVLKDAIIAKYRNDGINAMGCDTGIVKMSALKEPVAQDWQQVWDYIKETGDFSLLHRRLATAAIKERWEDGKTIPGVGVQDVFKLSISAAPTKQS